MALPAWMSQAGLTDEASGAAYNTLFDAMARAGAYDPVTLGNIRRMRGFDQAIVGRGVAPGAAQSFSQRIARDTAGSEDELKREFRDRALQDALLYGQTFQRGAITYSDNVRDRINQERALKDAKRKARRKQWGGLLSAVGSVLSVIPATAPIGAGMVVAGNAVSGSGHQVSYVPAKRTMTSQAPAKSVLGTAGTSAPPPSDPYFATADPFFSREKM